MLKFSMTWKSFQKRWLQDELKIALSHLAQPCGDHSDDQVTNRWVEQFFFEGGVGNFSETVLPVSKGQEDSLCSWKKHEKAPKPMEEHLKVAGPRHSPSASSKTRNPFPQQLG